MDVLHLIVILKMANLTFLACTLALINSKVNEYFHLAPNNRKMFSLFNLIPSSTFWVTVFEYFTHLFSLPKLAITVNILIISIFIRHTVAAFRSPLSLDSYSLLLISHQPRTYLNHRLVPGPCVPSTRWAFSSSSASLSLLSQCPVSEFLYYAVSVPLGFILPLHLILV